ncbi:hypothetical protein ACQ4M3_13255 [Leptolyngbya sp. AN03gr2]|uniref:hypothetical protein n=1 Tax=Leptolyngbya sp. AN03gr2 TaxID=3423364 RepID=UPI003D320752
MRTPPNNHLKIRNIYDEITWLYGSKESCSQLDLLNQPPEGLDDYFQRVISGKISESGGLVAAETPIAPFGRFKTNPTLAEIIDRLLDDRRIYLRDGTSVAMEPEIDSNQTTELRLPTPIDGFIAAIKTIAHWQTHTA